MAKTVCFIGHRKCDLKDTQMQALRNTITDLIANGVDTFLFGSRSDFDNLCWEIVTELKEEYSHIKRVYVRAEYQYVSESYEKDLLKYYEKTFYPECIENSGKYAYVERNQYMINHSDICIFAYDKNYVPTPKPWVKPNKWLPEKPLNSGTAIAFKYANQKKKKIVNVLKDC